MKPTATTPLLMPPPSTSLSSFQHRVAVFIHHREVYLRHHQYMFVLVKLSIFAAKVISLWQPCTPLATRGAILWPLLGLAGMELGLSDIGWVSMGLLALIHVLVLGIASSALGGGLCIRGGLNGRWNWD